MALCELPAEERPDSNCYSHVRRHFLNYSIHKASQRCPKTALAYLLVEMGVPESPTRAKVVDESLVKGLPIAAHRGLVEDILHVKGLIGV